MELIDFICTSLGVLPHSTGISSYASRRAFTYAEVIAAYLPTRSTKEASEILGIQHATLEKYLQRNWIFDRQRLHKEHWCSFLLRVANLKYCTSCKQVQAEDKYFTSNTRSRGLQPICKICEQSKSQEYYIQNAAIICAKSKEYYLYNIDSVSETHRIYASEHKTEYNARTAKRRAAKLQRTPSWANLDKIKEIYRTCPEGYHVDHIVPLQGELVSGLHIEYNLQHLPASENLAKGNKFNYVDEG